MEYVYTKVTLNLKNSHQRCLNISFFALTIIFKFIIILSKFLIIL